MPDRMSLGAALHILASVHTRNDDVTGFVVEMGAYPGPWTTGPMRDQRDYVMAWKIVREAAGLPTEPEDYSR